MIAFYFGYVEGYGHGLIDQYGNHVRDRDSKSLPKYLRLPDATLTPNISGEPEGVAKIIVDSEGWTVLSFWDRSGDRRPGSNTNFILKGTFSFEEALNYSKDIFPNIFSRITFPIVLFKK